MVARASQYVGQMYAHLQGVALASGVNEGEFDDGHGPWG
jgi:hypothetical protein